MAEENNDPQHDNFFKKTGHRMRIRMRRTAFKNRITGMMYRGGIRQEGVSATQMWPYEIWVHFYADHIVYDTVLNQGQAAVRNTWEIPAELQPAVAQAIRENMPQGSYHFYYHRDLGPVDNS